MFDINKLIKKIIIKFPPFADILLRVKVEEGNFVETAATNGKVIYYSKPFIEELPESQQLFLLSHEICHIALNHMYRRKEKDLKVWNIATDAVINAQLIDRGLEMIPGGVEIEGALNYDAEELYDILMKQKEKQEEPSSQGNPQENDNSSSESQENNESNSESQENANQQDEKEEGSNDNSMHSEHIIIEDVDFDSLNEHIRPQHEMWDEANEPQIDNQNNNTSENNENTSEKNFFDKAKNEAQEKIEELKRDLARESAKISKRGSYSQGTGSEGQKLDIKPDETKRPSMLDWKNILKASLNRTEYDWRLGKKVRYGVIPYTLKPTNYKPKTEILLDTSGSISYRLLKGFLREVRSILKTSSISVGCFDEMFYGFTEIRTEKDIDNMSFRGGGGTDFNVAVESFSPNAENKIIFTDGYAATPNQSCNAIWLVFPDEYYHEYPKDFNPKGGRVIHITEEQLQKLLECKTDLDR